VLNGRVDVKRLFFFFLIRRNWRRQMDSDFASMGFLRFGGCTSNILRLLYPPLNHTMGVGCVRHGPVIEEVMYKKQEESQ
jgi:hypothetical protein